MTSVSISTTSTYAYVYVLRYWCNSGVEDDFHFICDCQLYNDQRAVLRRSVYLRWHLPHPNRGYFPDFWLFASICFCRISAAAVSLIIEETRKEAQKELTSGSVIDNCRLLNLAFRSFLSQGCVVYLARLFITERYEKVFFFHFNPISLSLLRSYYRYNHSRCVKKIRMEYLTT